MTAEPDTTRTRLTANILTALADENTRLRAAGQALADALKAAETGRNDHGPHWNTAQLVAAIRRFLVEWADATGEQTPT